MGNAGAGKTIERGRASRTTSLPDAARDKGLPASVSVLNTDESGQQPTEIGAKDVQNVVPMVAIVNAFVPFELSRSLGSEPLSRPSETRFRRPRFDERGQLPDLCPQPRYCRL